jgi:N-formylglutamate amidohydrolase
MNPKRPSDAVPPWRLSGALDGASPLVLASPHSGTELPEGFLAASRLGPAALRRIEDAHVGALLAESAALGVPLLEATHSRAVIDLNRAEDEIDPSMFAGMVVRTPRLTDRVRRGYGLFPRVAGPNQLIHAGRLPPRLAEERLATLHRPWHTALADGLDRARQRHGYAVLLDIHSMPPLEGIDPPRLVLGDLNGQSAAPQLVCWLESAFQAEGLKVGRNIPYAGGHTTERHGRPSEGLHCVQLEFDRTLYMEMGSLAPHQGFAPLAALIARVVAGLGRSLPITGLGTAIPLAAE